MRIWMKDKILDSIFFWPNNAILTYYKDTILY